MWKKKLLHSKQTKNSVTFTQNFGLKYNLLNANITQETKKVKGSFAFSYKHYVCEFVYTTHRYEHIHKATICVVTELHFVLQSRFSETESYTHTMCFVQ